MGGGMEYEWDADGGTPPDSEGRGSKSHTLSGQARVRQALAAGDKGETPEPAHITEAWGRRLGRERFEES